MNDVTVKDVLYDCMHYALHHTTLPKYMKDMKKYHLAHHYKNFELGFGVTSCVVVPFYLPPTVSDGFLLQARFGTSSSTLSYPFSLHTRMYVYSFVIYISMHFQADPIIFVNT